MKRIIIAFVIFVGCFSFAFGQQTIKVLAIGNSFSEDAVENFLYNLANAGNVNIVIGNAYIGGCSLTTHWTNASGNNAAYSYRKIVNGQKTTTDSQTLLKCITDESWDYITFQQVSTNSGVLSTYFPYLTNLTNYVKSNATNSNVKFAMHMTWAYPQASDKPEFAANYNRDQMTMYNAIVNAVWSAASQVGVDMVIPSGTAIQNGRSSHVNDSIAIGNTVNDNFNRDGSHLSLTLGRFTASCVWYEKLTGKSVLENTYKPSNLTAFQTKIAKNAAHLAIQNPKVITDMQSYGQEDYTPVYYNVPIRVVDKTKGVRTSNAGFTEVQNVVIGLSTLLKFQGQGTDAWYYPLFTKSGTTGQLIKNDTAWIWQATIQAPVGSHSWYPALKTLTYNPMNKRMIYYGESNYLGFSISDEGVISGTTQITIDNTQLPVILKVIDKSKGTATNGTGDFNEKNVYLEGGKPTLPDARVQTNLDTEYITPTFGSNVLEMYRQQGNLEKNDTAWIWSATVNVKTGNYTWTPKLKTTSASINSTAAIQFNVDLTGNITGKTTYTIQNNPSAVDNIKITSSIKVYPTTFDNYIRIIGCSNFASLYNIDGRKLIENIKSPIDEDINLNTSTLQKGIYLLLVDGRYGYKLIK